MNIGTIGLALLAGGLSALSPCVLSLLPIVLGTAASKHRLAPFVLAAGLALSFVVIGLFVATIGFAIGLDTDVFRIVSAVLLNAIGMLLLIPRLGAQVAAAGGPVRTGSKDSSEVLPLTASAVSSRSACCSERYGALRRADARRRLHPGGQGREPRSVALSMIASGVRAALPLILLGLLSREAFSRWRGRLMEAGKGGKALLGGFLVVIGLMVATGIDKKLETLLVNAPPAWLARLTTSF